MVFAMTRGPLRSRRLVVGVSVLALVLSEAVLGVTPAQAVVVPGGPNFETITNGLPVNGNLTSAGNGLLTCGAACSLHATGGPGNNGFLMTYVDVDQDPATFNSSSAHLTIPAGATIARAWLMWQANGWAPPRTATNGLCNTAAGAVPQSRDAVQASQPLMAVDGAPYQVLGAADYTSTTPITAQYWLVNGATDVTDELQGVGGGTHTVTVANILASQGTACTAGWALHVAYDYGHYIIGNPDSARRLIYTGFGSTVVFNNTQTVTFGGFRTASPGATLLISAGDGELPGGDTARLVWPGNTTGEALANPAGSTTNLFNSTIDGDISYANPPDATFHNGSFDTFLTRSSLLPTGSTSADFQFRSTNDGFYAHSVSLAVEVAQLRVTKLPGTGVTDAQIVQTGQPPEYRILFNNDSAVAITDLEFDDANSVSCSLDGTGLPKTGITYALADLPAGAQITARCTGPAVHDGDRSYTNTATARGSDPNGASVGPVSDTSAVLVPHLSTTKSAFPAAVIFGENVTWTVTVTNDGGTDLRDITLADTGCTTTLSSPTGPGAPTLLTQGNSWAYTCTEPGTADKTNTATASAEPFATIDGQQISGQRVSDSAEATVTVGAEPLPHLTLTKTVDQATVNSGDSVTWTVTVTNDGGTSLRNVAVTDPTCPDLNGPTGTGAPTTLEALSTWSYTCTQTLLTDTTNHATATADSFRVIDGVDTPGPTVTANAEAHVQVTPIPHLTVHKTIDHSVVTEGQPVTWTITATNDGQADLRNVTITDPGCSGTLSSPTGLGSPTQLSIGATWTFTCTENAQSDKTNTATVTAESFHTTNGIDFPGPTATATASAAVTVVGAADITLNKKPDRAAVTTGDIVTWTMTATNTGAADLRDVTLTDTTCAGTLSAPSGPGAPAVLAINDIWTYTCTQTITTDTTNTATITAVPFRLVDGTVQTTAPVGVSAAATVIAVAEAHLTVQKAANSTHVSAGDTVTWTIQATNDGDADLHHVEVSDADCAGTISAPRGPGSPTILKPGDSWTYTCAEAITVSKTNTARVTATPFRVIGDDTIEGTTVTDNAEAHVDVATVVTTDLPSAAALAATGIAAGSTRWIALFAVFCVVIGGLLSRRRARAL
jgi:uncharacterized repeat protein (TIGR01451 family)